MDEAMTNEVNEFNNPGEMTPGQPAAAPDLASPGPDLQAGIPDAGANANPNLTPDGPDLTSPPAPDMAGPTAGDHEMDLGSLPDPPAEAYSPAVNRPVPAEFAPFIPEEPKEEAKLGMLMDVALHVTVELGRTRIPVREVLDLQSGSVIELEREAGEVVDVFVNEHLIAKGEVVVVDDKYGIRITEFIKNDQIIGAS